MQKEKKNLHVIQHDTEMVYACVTVAVVSTKIESKSNATTTKSAGCRDHATPFCTILKALVSVVSS